MSKFKVNDKVKAVKSGSGISSNELGSIVTIAEVGTYCGNVGYKVAPAIGNSLKGFYGGFIGEKSFELVVSEAVPTEVLYEFKEGDLVKRKDGEKFSNGKKQVKVGAFVRHTEYHGNTVWLEMGTYLHYDDLELVESAKIIEFKKGDKIISVSDNGFGIRIGGVYTVLKHEDIFVYLLNEGGDDRKRLAKYYTLYEEADESPQEDKTKWHKHHDLIVAWAKGEEVEYRNKLFKEWITLDHEEAVWESTTEYRLNPAKKEQEVSEIEQQIKELSEKLTQLKGA